MRNAPPTDQSLWGTSKYREQRLSKPLHKDCITMKYLKDPESQVVTRRLAKDVIARFNEQIEEYNTIVGRLKSDGSDYATEQMKTAYSLLEDRIQRARKAISEGVQVSSVSPQVVHDVEALDNVVSDITEFVRKVDAGEFDESELAEYGE